MPPTRRCRNGSSAWSKKLPGEPTPEQPGGRRRLSYLEPKPIVVLPHGRFLGAAAWHRTAGGFCLGEHVPTVAPEEVVTHTHPDAHFVLLLAGTYVSSADGAAPLARPPLLIYNPPGTTHRDRFHTLAGRFFTVSPSAQALARIVEAVRPVDHPTALTADRALVLAHQLAGECRTWDTASPLVAEGLCLALMGEMARTANRPYRQQPSWLRLARECLRDRCGEHVRMSEIAHVAGVHPVHLARAFREFFHCTPGEYFRRCRLERAAHLLAYGRLPVAHIAAEAGFADQSHFSKAFRKAFSTTPREFRRAHVSR